MFALGGNIERPRELSSTFRGLKEYELLVSQVISSKLSVQFNLIRDFYLSPHVNFGIVGNDTIDNFKKNIFRASPKWTSLAPENGLIFSAGLGASYKSIIGPLNIDATWVNDIDRFRVFVGVGIPIGRLD